MLDAACRGVYDRAEDGGVAEPLEPVIAALSAIIQKYAAPDWQS